MLAVHPDYRRLGLGIKNLKTNKPNRKETSQEEYRQNEGVRGR